MATRKTEWLASIKPILDKEEVKNDAKALAKEVSDILEFKVTDADSLEQLTKEFNEQLANMGKQQIVFSEKTLQGIVSQFANAIAGGLSAGVNLGAGKLGQNIGDGIANDIVSGVKQGIADASRDIIAQINDLTKRKNELHEQSSKLDKRLKSYETLSEISTMEYDEFKPLKIEGDIDEQAQRIMGEFIDAEDALNEVTRGTKEYNAALIKALQASEKLYRMARTINDNKDLVTDKTLLSDFEFSNLSDTTADVFEKADADFNKILRNFYGYYEKQIKNIKVELGQIDEQMQALQQNKVEIIDQEKSKSALKTLKEIEEAYKRILKKEKSAEKVNEKISSAINYIPGSKSLAVLKNRYDKSLSSNENWEVQYQWLVKFVKEYEDQLAKVEAETDGSTRRNHRATLRRYDELYNQLSPIANIAEASLNQIIGNDAKPNGAGGNATSGPSQEDVDNANEIAEAGRRAREDAEAKPKAEKEAAEFEKQKRIEEEKTAKAAERKKAAEDAAEKERQAKEASMTNALRKVVDFSGKQSKEYMSLIGSDATTDVIGGEDYTVATDVLVEQLIDNVKKSILMSLHNHPDNILAFTPSDIMSYGKLYKTQGVDIHGIIADGIIQTIDFTSISQEVILQIAQAFSKNLSEAADNSEGLFSFKDSDLKVSDDVQALANLSPDAYNKIKDQLQFVINNELSKAFTDNKLQPTIKTLNTENLQELAKYLLQVGQNAGVAVNEAEKLNTLTSIKDKIVGGKKEETSAHQQNAEAIKSETKAQEELNKANGQGSGSGDTIVDNNTKKIQSYEELHAILKEYLDLEKQKTKFEYTDEDWKWDGLSDRYRGMQSSEEIKDDFDAQWKRVLNIKNAIKNGYDSYLDPETKSSERLQENTLEEETKRLKAIALAYADNTETNLDLLNKTQRKFVDDVVSARNAWREDYDRRITPYKEHNDPIQNRQWDIESIITNSTSLDNYGGILNDFYNAAQIGQFDTDTVERFAKYLGIELPQAAQIAGKAIAGLNNNLEETQNTAQISDIQTGAGDASSVDVATAQAEAEKQRLEKERIEAEKIALQQENEAKLKAEADAKAKLQADLTAANQQLKDVQESKVLADANSKKAEDESRVKDGIIQSLREQLAQVQPSDGGAKASIDVEELKNVLNAITYNVKVVQDSDGADNKVAIDETSLEATLNKVFANILNPQTRQNDGENNQSPWALESTLQTVKGVLDNIQTNTAKIGTVNTSNLDTIAGTALDGRLSEIKNVLDSIDNKIAKGGVIATRGAVKQANVNTKKTPTASTMKSVIKDYETLGKLSAQFANDRNLETKIKLDNLKAEIREKRVSLNITVEENAKLREKYKTAFDVQKRLFDAAKAKKQIDQQNKDAENQGRQDQSVRSNMMKSIVKDYQTLGKLSAKFANDGNLETKARLENLKEEIKRKRASLTVTMEENAKLREQYSIAFDAQKRLLDAADKEKAWKKRVKGAQRETGINAADSAYRAANDTVLKTIGTNGISSDISQKAEELSKQVSALSDLRNDIYKKGDQASEKDRDNLSKQISQVKTLKTELDGYLKIHEKYSGDNVTDLGDASTFGAAGTDEYWNNITKAIQAQTQGRVVIKGLNADTGELTGTTKIAANTFAQWSATVDPITGRLSMLRTGIKKSETLIESITRKTKEIFTYFSGSSIIFKFFNELKQGVQYVKEIDLALTELKKVTDETEETYDRFLQTAAKTADRVGSTIKDIVSSTADWARLGSMLA